MQDGPRFVGGLLCDLDGVVRLWPAHVVAVAEDAAGLPRGSIHETAFAADLLPLAITGRLSDEAWREEVGNRLRAAYPEADARGAVAGWSASPGVVNQPVLDLLRQRRVPVALITNATSRLHQDLAALGLDGEFDHIINSSRLGVAKPDSGIFEAALQAIGLPADQVLFIDDDARHVAGATELGIRSYQFMGDVPELDEVLRVAGIVR
ncbi:MAG: HAD-IA family hydrolase [Thermomicrobiales bacterium]